MSNREERTECVECVRDWSQVDPWKEAWNAAAGSNFMLRSEWLESWWNAYQGSGDRLAIARLPSRLSGGPSFLPGFVTRGILGRTYRWLGSGAVCSDDLRLIGPADEAEQAAAGEMAAEWLRSETFRKEFGRLDAIELEGYLADEASVRGLIRGLQAAGWSLEEREIGGAWKVGLPATVEAYVGIAHKSRRRKVNKAKRLLSEGKVRYEAIGEWSRMDELWSEFVRLHQKRRAALGQPGCFSDPRFGIFLRSAAEQMAQAQQCWMGSLWAGEEPIGININFCSGGSFGMYQSGMEMDRTELEPGHLLNYFSIGTAIERGNQWFDFLRGDEPYKEGWGAQRRALFRSRLFAPHLLARVRQTALAAGRELRSWSAGWFGNASGAMPASQLETTAD